MADITVQKVTAENNPLFYTIPWHIYQDDPNWIPPLIQDIQAVFNPDKNSFYKKGQTQRYIAFLGGKPAGRIAAMVNSVKDYQSNPKLGGFGFFECVNDQHVANALFSAASEWLFARDLEGMRGPINFGETDRWWGLLIENFAEAPTYGINYNPPYYIHLIEQYGMVKDHDQLSYKIQLEEPIPERLKQIASRAVKRNTVEIRMINMKNLSEEAETIRTIYNKAWQEMDIEDFFDTFTPLTSETAQQMINELKPILIPEGVWIAFVDNEPASFVLTIPDVNQAFRYLNGKFNLFAKLKFLWHRKDINRLRVIAFGTVKKYRRMGLEAAIFAKGLSRIKNDLPQYREVIGAWTGEENWLMQRSIEGAGGQVYQKHRTYELLFSNK